MYQRSLGVHHLPGAEDVEGSARSIHEAPVAKRRRTTAQVETGAVYSVWSQRNVFSLLLKKESEEIKQVCLVYAPDPVSSSWLDSGWIGSGLDNPALTSTFRKQGSDTEQDSEDEFLGYVKFLK